MIQPSLEYKLIHTYRTEETNNAATAGSWGILTSIGVSAVLGWFLILGLLFSIQDYASTIGSSTGQPVAQILIDAVGQRPAIALMVVIVVAMYFCGCVYPILYIFD